MVLLAPAGLVAAHAVVDALPGSPLVPALPAPLMLLGAVGLFAAIAISLFERSGVPSVGPWPLAAAQALIYVTVVLAAHGPVQVLSGLAHQPALWLGLAVHVAVAFVLAAVVQGARALRCRGLRTVGSPTVPDVTLAGIWAVRRPPWRRWRLTPVRRRGPPVAVVAGR